MSLGCSFFVAAVGYGEDGLVCTLVIPLGHPVQRLLYATTVVGCVRKGVGTAGATGALAPAVVKPRRRKYLFAPAII